MAGDKQQQQQHCFCHQLMQEGNNEQYSTTASSLWLKSKQKLLLAVLGMKEKQQQQNSNEEAATTRIPAWMEELWKFLTPWHLQQTVFPQVDPIILQRILDKLQARILFLEQQQQEQQQQHSTDDSRRRQPQKIQVLVFGGSLTEGVGCDAPPPSYLMDDENEKAQFMKFPLSLQECSWPHRLQQLADAFLPDAIEIHNLAVGGTHSRAAVPILEHGLYPPHVHVNENTINDEASDSNRHDPPDIILNAYAANDNLPPAFYNTENTTLDNFHKYRVLKRLMEFVAAASSTGTAAGGNANCERQSSQQNSPPQQQQQQQPWIVFVNDYLGNQQESLVGESTVDELVQLLMQTLVPVSYVSPVRLLEPYVWANTTEHVWSGVWKKKQKKKQKQQDDTKNDYKVDVHYGMAGHITTAMVTAHAFFQWTMEHCQEQVLFDMEEEDCSSPNYWTTATTPLSSLQTTLETRRMQPNELSRVLQIDLPSKEWMKVNHPDRVYPNITEGRNAKTRNGESSSSTTITGDCRTSRRPGCAFAFLAAPLGTHSKKGPLQEYIDRFTIIHDDASSRDGGWLVQNNFRHGGFQNKLGLVATRTGAQLELNIPIGNNWQQQQHMKLTIHYLKSYGPDWANSHLRGSIQVVRQKEGSAGGQQEQVQVLREQSFDLEGFHDQQVSISYTHVVPNILVDNGGETIIQLKLELIGGSNFKINAMMLCF